MSARWLAAPAVAVIVAAGVWVAGGVITDDFRTSMALTAVWFLAAGAAALAIGIRNRALRVPVIGGYLVAAAAITGVLAWTTLRDTTVHEQIAAGAPVSAGEFRSLEHSTRGTATVVRTSDGRHLLALTAFSTAAGPDLRVRLVPGDSTDGGADGARDLGALKGNIGDQQYALPSDVDLGRYRSVVIWCRAFSAAFAQAPLEES